MLIKQRINDAIVSHTPSPAHHICPICGHPSGGAQPFCAQCAAEIDSLCPTDTLKISRKPMAIPKTQSQTVTFTPDMRIIMQMLPSGTCFTLPVKLPTVVGRNDGEASQAKYPLIDLSPYNMVQHGVSRRHCLIKRHENRLLLADLGSTNGTYLNGEQLVSFLGYPLADGDRLVLGSLHLIISFTQ